MSSDGVLSEFDPLAASKQSNSMSAQPTAPSRDKEKETISILDEFDPLTQKREADKEQVSLAVKQGSAAPLNPAQSTTFSSALQLSGATSPAKSIQPYTSGTLPQDNGSSKELQSANKMDNSSVKKRDKPSRVSQSAVSEVGKSDRIGAEISQIDSVLKALNMGQFDLGIMTPLTGTTATPQTQGKPPSSQPKQPEAMPAAVRSTGLSLIGQLGSGDSGSSSESEDSSSDSSDDSMGLARELRRGNDSGSEEEGGPAGGRKQRLPMSKGEVDYRTLPAPEHNDIPFPVGGTIMPMGKVSHLAEKLVVIQALPGTPPFDEGTVIWTKEKKSIAKIFETFGPVKSPLYSVLVESVEHASSLGLTPGQLVYVVPSNMELTRYVFTKQLMKQKGSDASWKDDNEVPAQFQDYSDDESEQAANKVKKQGGKRARQSATSTNPQQQQLQLQHDVSPVPGALQPQSQAYTPPHQHHSLNPLQVQSGIPVPPTSSGYAYYPQQGGAYNTGSTSTYSNYNLYSGYQAPYPPPQ